LAALDRENKANLQRLANYERERDQLYNRFAGRSAVPSGISDQLAALSRRYPSLHFDPQSGASKLDTDVLFATAQADLKPEARQMLTEFSAILRSPQAAGLRLMIVGHTDDERIRGAEVREEFPNNWHLSAHRALAVADFLRATGVPEGRMGVAGL